MCKSSDYAVHLNLYSAIYQLYISKTEKLYIHYNYN